MVAPLSTPLVHVRRGDGLLDTFRPSRYTCHRPTRLTMEAVAYSRGADTARPGQSACSPGTPWPVTRGCYQLECGWLREMIYYSDPQILVIGWPFSYRDSTTSSWDSHCVVDVATVSMHAPGDWGLKLGPRRWGSSFFPPYTIYIAAWGLKLCSRIDTQTHGS